MTDVGLMVLTVEEERKARKNRKAHDIFLRASRPLRSRPAYHRPEAVRPVVAGAACASAIVAQLVAQALIH